MKMRKKITDSMRKEEKDDVCVSSHRKVSD